MVLLCWKRESNPYLLWETAFWVLRVYRFRHFSIPLFHRQIKTNHVRFMSVKCLMSIPYSSILRNRLFLFKPGVVKPIPNFRIASFIEWDSAHTLRNSDSGGNWYFNIYLLIVEVEGFEPTMQLPKSWVLPLHHTSIIRNLLACYIYCKDSANIRIEQEIFNIFSSQILFASRKAEREGFEPPDLLRPIVFKTTSIDHSDTFPYISHRENSTNQQL